jgi:hypothetical protein
MLAVDPPGWLPAFGRADVKDCVPIFMHTHPRMRAEHSELDLRLDEELARVADNRLDAGIYGSLVLGGAVAKPTFAGRLTGRDTAWTPIDRIRVVGQRLTLFAHDGTPPLPLFDRQVRAFGEEGQRLPPGIRRVDRQRSHLHRHQGSAQPA